MRLLFLLLLSSALFLIGCDKVDPQPQQNITTTPFDTATFFSCNTISTAPSLEYDIPILYDRLWDHRVSFMDGVYTLLIFFFDDQDAKQYIRVDISPDSKIQTEFKDIGTIEITPDFCDDKIFLEQL